MFKINFFSFFIFLFFIPFSSFANRLDGCGTYSLKGRLVSEKENPLKMKFVVFEKTNSELSFFFKDQKELFKIHQNFNQFINFEAQILKKNDGTHAFISSLKKIHLTPYNPLNREKDLIKLNSLPCKK